MVPSLHKETKMSEVMNMLDLTITCYIHVSNDHTVPGMYDYYVSVKNKCAGKGVSHLSGTGLPQCPCCLSDWQKVVWDIEG